MPLTTDSFFNSLSGDVPAITALVTLVIFFALCFEFCQQLVENWIDKLFHKAKKTSDIHESLKIIQKATHFQAFQQRVIQELCLVGLVSILIYFSEIVGLTSVFFRLFDPNHHIDALIHSKYTDAMKSCSLSCVDSHSVCKLIYDAFARQIHSEFLETIHLAIFSVILIYLFTMLLLSWLVEKTIHLWTSWVKTQDTFEPLWKKFTTKGGLTWRFWVRHPMESYEMITHYHFYQCRCRIMYLRQHYRQYFSENPGSDGYDGVRRGIRTLIVEMCSIHWSVWLIIWFFAILNLIRWSFLKIPPHTSILLYSLSSWIELLFTMALRHSLSAILNSRSKTPTDDSHSNTDDSQPLLPSSSTLSSLSIPSPSPSPSTNDSQPLSNTTNFLDQEAVPFDDLDDSKFAKKKKLYFILFQLLVMLSSWWTAFYVYYTIVVFSSFEHPLYYGFILTVNSIPLFVCFLILFPIMIQLFALTFPQSC